MNKKTQQILAFAFGIAFISILLIIALVVDKPTEYQFFVFRLILALSAAGIGTVIPGFLEVQIPIYVRAGGALAIFVIIWFFNPGSYVVKYNPTTQQTRELYGKAVNLRGQLEALPSYPSYKDRIRKEAPAIADSLETLDDAQLDIAHQIVKYQYAGICYIVAANVEPDSNKQIEYADKYLVNYGTAIRIIDGLETETRKSDYERSTLMYIKKEDITNNLHYLAATAYAIKRINGQPIDTETIRNTLLKVDPVYIERYPISADRFIAAVLKP